MKSVRIPRYIDSPMQFAFWEIDELIPMAVLFLFGLIMNQLLYSFVLMWIAVSAYKRYKYSSRRGALVHGLFWFGVYSIGGRMHNGLARRYMG